MTARRPPPVRLGLAAGTQLTAALRRTGLSAPGVQQALQGNVVSSAADRAAIARILAAFGSLPPHVVAAVYDFPGAYAQRFDDDDRVG